MAAINMFDHVIGSNNPMVKSVVKSFHIANNIMITRIPMENNATFKINGSRVLGGHATPAWLNIDDMPSTYSVKTDQYAESAHVLRVAIKIPVAMKKEKNQIGGPGGTYRTQMEALRDMVTFDENNKLFHNEWRTGAGDPLAPVGIKERIDQGDAWGINTTDMKVNAAGLDVSPSGMTNLSIAALLEEIRFMIGDRMSNKGGAGIIMCMPSRMAARMTTFPAVLNNGALWATNKDNYGREFESYAGAEILDVGRTAPTATGAQTGRVLTTFEQADGTAGTEGTDKYGSIYFLYMGDEYLSGWHYAPLDVTIFPPSNADTVNELTQIEHICGIRTQKRWSLGRIYGIKMVD